MELAGRPISGKSGGSLGLWCHQFIAGLQSNLLIFLFPGYQWLYCCIHSSVLKFGVGISTDSKRLASAGILLAGCVDLQNIAVRCGLRLVINK